MSNVEKLREVCRLWNETKGTSIDKWMELMAEDIVFRSSAGGAAGVEFTGDRRSKDEMARYFAGLSADWEMIHFTSEEFLEAGEWVVMRGQCAFRHRRTGKSFETPRADFVRFRDGKIVEYFEFYNTAKVLAAAKAE